MKPLIAFSICLLAFGTSFAQTKATTKKKIKTNKPAIAGNIQDTRRHPIKGVEAFVYSPKDSSIAASGYTDSAGNYETNAVMPGIYDLKIVYPNTKMIYLKGVTVKAGLTPVNLKVAIPESDTVLNYTDMFPKVEEKKKTAKK